MSSYRPKILVAAAALLLHAASGAAQLVVQTGQSLIWSDLDSGRSMPMELSAASGSTLHFSNGVDPAVGLPSRSVAGWVGFANITNQQLQGVGGAEVQETRLSIGTYRPEMTRAVVTLASPVASVGVDGDSGQLQSVSLQGGLTMAADYKPGILDGGGGTIANLEVDLINKRVYADASANLGQWYEYPLQRITLWTFESFSGPTTWPGFYGSPANGWLIEEAAGNLTITASHAISGLKLTEEGSFFLNDLLGQPPTLVGYQTMAGLNGTGGWGSLNYSISFTTPVPEPSFYSLTGVGILLVAWTTRRRSRVPTNAAAA